MKNAIIIILAALLCSFGYNKQDHAQRRKGIMNVDTKGNIVFTPLPGAQGEWKDFTPVNDTIYQYKVTKK